jgi:hypothetical protein
MTKALLHELGQSLSFGRLSLRAKVLWPMLLASSDDQGRGLAEADAIKWHVCPNVPEIDVDDVPELLNEMIEQSMITVYNCDRECSVYQITRWWEYQDLQWARPSKYSAPDGWKDRIRYSNRGDYHVENWPSKEPPSKQGRKPPSKSGRLPTQPNSTQPNSTELNSTEPIEDQESANADDEGPPLTETEIPEQPEKEPESAEPSKPQPPATLQGWIDCLDTYSNHPALVRRMIDIHYPGRDPPPYSFIGSTAKKLGRGKNGYTRLISLLWQCSANSVKGDILPYVLAVAKKDKSNAAYHRNGSGRQRASPERDSIFPVPEPPTELEVAWGAALDELSGVLGQQATDQWLRRSMLLERENGHATIQLADQACVDWVSNRWKDQIAGVLVADGESPEVEYVVAPAEEAPSWMQT